MSLLCVDEIFAYAMQYEEELMSRRLIACAAFVFFRTATLATAQAHPPEIPKHSEAIAPNQSFFSAKTVSIAVTSRRPVNPAPPEDLERIRRRVVDTLPKIPFSLVSDSTSADLRLEMIVEPNVRYGMYHYQNAPYVYITLREPSGGHLVYCAYQRASHFYSVSEQLLRDLQRRIERTDTTPTGSLAACAEQAMRPL